MNKKLMKNAIFNVFYQLLNVIFPLFSATYISRVLLPAGVGRVAYAQNIVSYFILIASLGIPIYGVKEIAKYNNNQEECNKVFSELVLLNTISTFLSCICYFSIIWSFTIFRQDIGLYLAVGVQLILNFANIDWLYKGKEDYVYIAMRSSAIKIISIICLFLFVRNQSDYIIYAIISSVAAAGNYLFNLFRLNKYVKISFKNISIKRHINSVVILLISIVETQLYSKLDITMLGIVCDDINVGYYSNANKITMIVITFTIALTTVFMPQLISHYEKNKKEFNDLVNFGIKLLMLVAIPCFIGINLVVGDMVKVLFGIEFQAIEITIRILSCLILIKSFGDMLCYQIIICTGNEKMLVRAYAVGTVINIIFNFMLISKFAENGAAIASVASELLINLILFVYVLKNIKIKFNISSQYMASIIISSICMIISVISINLINIDEWIRLILSAISAIITYLIIALVLKNEILIQILKKMLLRNKKLI